MKKVSYSCLTKDGVAYYFEYRGMFFMRSSTQEITTKPNFIERNFIYDPITGKVYIKIGG